MKTIVGSFDSFDEAKRVAQQLMDDGFRDGDVNVVANNASGQYGGGMTGAAIEGVRGSERPAGDTALTTDGGGLTDAERTRERDGVVDDASGAATGAVTGGVVGGAAGLAASLIGLAIPGIGPIIAAGPIVAVLSGAGVGAVAGGLIGGLTDMGVPKGDAEYYAESLRRGGALVSVRADDTRAEHAADVMRDHGAVDIERRADQWRERGWTGWNERAAPYTADEINRDRDLYGATDRTTGLAGGMEGDRTNAETVAGRGTAPPRMPKS